MAEFMRTDCERNGSSALPAGWAWYDFPDGSGCLCSPSGKVWIEYNRKMGLYREMRDRPGVWTVWDVVPRPMNLVEFKSWAVDYLTRLCPGLEEWNRDWVAEEENGFRLRRKHGGGLYEFYRVQDFDSDDPGTAKDEDPAFLISHALISVEELDRTAVLEACGCPSLEMFQAEFLFLTDRKLAEYTFEQAVDRQQCILYGMKPMTFEEARERIWMLADAGTGIRP